MRAVGPRDPHAARVRQTVDAIAARGVGGACLPIRAAERPPGWWVRLQDQEQVIPNPPDHWALTQPHPNDVILRPTTVSFSVSVLAAKGINRVKLVGEMHQLIPRFGIVRADNGSCISVRVK